MKITKLSNVVTISRLYEFSKCPRYTPVEVTLNQNSNEIITLVPNLICQYLFFLSYAIIET
jgi:hypothetical protein